MKRNQRFQLSLARLMGLAAFAALLCFGLRAAEREDFVEMCNFALSLFIVDAILLSYSQMLRPFLAGAILGGSGYLLLVVNIEQLRPETLLERPPSGAFLFTAHGAATLAAGFATGLMTHWRFRRRQPPAAVRNRFSRYLRPSRN